MPDITMCGGDECPRRETCYRYTARPDYMQSFFTVPPMKKDKSCDHYREDLFTTRDSNPGLDKRIHGEQK
jgi:hypothetical protein